MDKKIYIDKVDVSGCEHYRAEIETKMPYGEYETLKDKCHYSGIEVIQNCKGNKGCIYKQLKRLEQENEELKFELKSEQKDKKYIKNCCIRAGKELEKHSFKWDGKEKNLVVQALELNEQYDKLQAENERLKEENYQLQKDCQICENFIDFIPCKPIRDMDYDLQKVISQRDNYYQALQEIREIAEKEIVCEDCNFEGTDKCDARMCTHFYLNDFSKDILDKINEVIGAE